MKMSYRACAVLVVLFFVLASWQTQPHTENNALQYFKVQAAAFAKKTNSLKTAIDQVKAGDTASVLHARKELAMCRQEFKKLEFLMEYYFLFPVNLYNRAPVYEVEEPFMEWQDPRGLQVVEALLYEDAPWENKRQLQDQANLVDVTAKDIPGILFNLNITNKQLFEAARLELVRVMTLGITGFDAPQMKTGLTESALALQAVKDNIAPLLQEKHTTAADSILYYIDGSIKSLQQAPSFDDFDRMQFLVQHALPLQRHLRNFIQQNGLELNTHPALNAGSNNLFAADALNQDLLSGTDSSANYKYLAQLGKKLFFETKLSGNGLRSCATCHKPGKYFTDALPKSLNIDGVREVRRNAPSLLYSGYQHAQFLDGRAHDMEEQISIVLQNPEEMNARIPQVIKNISNSEYRKLFKLSFPQQKNKDSLITARTIGTAIAAFEKTLAPFSAPFDKYMNGDATTMNASQLKGFNLFMGKAQCGTCHFAPMFNNLLPPYYEISEMEVLGTPRNGDLLHPLNDEDSGRYHFFPVQYNNGAFKTPSIRNVAVTAPYMHNGSFKTLEDVVEFYNKGGGQGIGLIVPEQTLSASPLGLTKEEVLDIVHFMESLTDPAETLPHSL